MSDLLKKYLDESCCSHCFNIDSECNKCVEKLLAEHDAQVRADAIDEELQNFAQWLWDSHYLVDEAFTIRLVEQYKDEQLKEKKNDRKM